ncbi:putative HAD-hydrolase YfnB [Tritrichomonas foetus]|uniref:HAD-hydrolase YfnB n=1 Tax=Tritrichomonas foetus TaxID=1144522 RepID=A0A1J4K7I1_9EUKA|nr:putative HAD-hydrolase YfnB [Tritrichomonas foetus]|eukprot:OHT07441.1 putative HAD-hydrolase YfnB [Tritrichomonas foetus]
MTEQNRKYDILLFDADGTLYDFAETEKNSIKWTWEQYGIPLNDETRGCFKKYNTKAWGMIEAGTLTIEELKSIRFKWTFEELGLNIDTKQFAEDFMINTGKTGVLFDGALNLLRELKNRGYKIYIVTNGIGKVQHSRFEKPETQQIYSGIFCGEDLGVSKPQKEFFMKVFEKIGVTEEEARSRCIVVGDSLTSDIQGGINAGLDTIWYNPAGKNSEKVTPTHIVSDYSQILALLGPLQE